MVEHIQFRDFQPSDAKVITFGEPGELLSRVGAPGAVSRVATWQGRIVGYAASWLAVVHRSRRFIDVVVAPDSRGHRIGTRLVEEIRARSHRPLATKAVEGSDAEAFILSLGGKAYATCPPLELPRRLFGRTREMLGGHDDVISAATLSPGEPEHLWSRYYEWVHEQWSPVDDTEEARAAVRSEAAELDLEHTSVALVDGQPAAVAFVFDDEGAPTVCAETVARDTPDGDEALARVISDVVSAAWRRGVRRLAFDGHQEDPHFGPLAAKLPLEGARLFLLELPLNAEGL
ncbi:MAG: GNAT family N-acetyltransferase [Acidipropionibacterium acidipropionici]|jgi:GNAT superfamily N-acetyltransferase|uniref:GNAT family N-acetyltransferase n=1 Tax=Acidipropionibacterium acidipropionici TaxID=1748 RepID=UPI0003F77E2A|nr:GNAT family N-acetyltransferase [Acidipropionibacterium acidipropionici]ALN15279.1 GNAT family acetyltransferase [Acidipropionibacterium acidipropionici]APZ08972.1 GNAT family N-acetyltransferase [Acidipropionibacterium acidipropionici]